MQKHNRLDEFFHWMPTIQPSAPFSCLVPGGRGHCRSTGTSTEYKGCAAADEQQDGYSLQRSRETEKEMKYYTVQMMINSLVFCDITLRWDIPLQYIIIIDHHVSIPSHIPALEWSHHLIKSLLEIILESLPKIDFPTASSMASVGTSRIPRSKVSFHSNKHRILEKQSHSWWGWRNGHDPNPWKKSQSLKITFSSCLSCLLYLFEVSSSYGSFNPPVQAVHRMRLRREMCTFMRCSIHQRRRRNVHVPQWQYGPTPPGECILRPTELPNADPSMSPLVDQEDPQDQSL